MHEPRDEFEQIVYPEFPPTPPTAYTDTSPYGIPSQPVKPGLTKRGKAALAIGATVVAGGSLIGYQAYSADAAEAQQKAQELAYKQQALELEKLREMNRITESQQKTQTSEAKARQASVDTCIKGKEHLIGKGFGSPSYRDIVDTCQAQYTDTASTGDDMAAAGSATDTNTGGGGVNDGFLIGGGVLGAIVLYAASKGKKSNPA